MESIRRKFANATNDLIDFESVYSVAQTEESLHALEVLRVELNSQWDQVKRSYTELRDTIPTEGEKPIDETKVRTRYKETLEAYKRCLSSLNAEIFAITSHEQDETTQNVTSYRMKQENDFPSISRLPACDTDIFYGGYKDWPTFRDLFSTLYIRNTRLSNVEKLFHLTQKTAGEAREIIRYVPLTHDGFDIAWGNLVDRYENRRMQVNEQLKTLFNLPQVAFDSNTSLQKLQRTMNSIIQTLNSLKINTIEWDPILVFLGSTKLPRNFLEEFENTLADCASLPTWAEFDRFLTHKFKTLESVGNIKPSKTNQPRSDFPKHEKRVLSLQTNITKNTGYSHNQESSKKYAQKYQQSCRLCQANHYLNLCSQFQNKSVNDRIHFVKTTHLCYNCLAADHGVKECKSRFSCRECNQRHHTLLHKGDQTHSTNSEPVRDSTRPSTSVKALTTFIQSTPSPQIPCVKILTLQRDESSSTDPQTNLETLLFTAIVQIESCGQRYDVRAIIDPGSQSTLISEKLKNRLMLPTKRNLVHVTGFSLNVAETSTKSCQFTLCSRVDPCFELEVWAPVLKTFPSILPPTTLDKNQLKQTAELNLADPQFTTSRPIDLLIGLDVGHRIYSVGSPIKSVGSLLALKTVFGWIVGGPIPQEHENNNNISLCNNISIEKIITRFWEVEETPKKVLRSEEDNFCEKNFIATTRRNDSGRYIVTLPFKSCEKLGTSRNIAMAQFFRMERKLLKTPDIKEQYDNVILEYLELGHMRKISPQDVEKAPHYYLPHHAVIKPDRMTTKLRVVFNASSSSSNKLSLNDILHPGPILQQDLVLQILKWRFFKYVFNADVTKMYRQILVDSSQTQYQRILFRKSPHDPVEDYELLTVTFGVNCAPFLAIRTLLQLAEDVKDKYPLASDIIRQNLYVDDVLAGGHTLEEAINYRKQLISALDSAGFELMKWTSNDPQLIQDLPEETRLPLNWLDLSEDSSTKTLGLRWNISSDSFSFKAPIIDKKPTFTKREVLSTIAKLFDPCGWLAPIIIVAKLIMQQVWLDKIDWDEALKPITAINWNSFVNNSSSIDTVAVPRWIHFKTSSNIEIHGFCDASESAYAATLYIRVEDSDLVYTSLLAAKTRVAPIKKISLPRLELCGAVLLSELANSIIPNLQISNFLTHYWTDSTIVLAWLKKPPCKWNTFVGNRISTILDNVGNDKWRHVDSESNPADIASRGCSAEDLKAHNLWWNGPHWLTLPKNQWPTQEFVEHTELESKPVKVFTTTTFEDPLNRFSSLSRAYRVLAYVFRWWRNKGRNRNNLTNIPQELSSEEINFVKNRLIMLTQKNYFPQEYAVLLQKKNISKSSSLLTLNPFLDSKNILRANGRLAQSTELTYNERYPIILPYDARFTKLLVDFVHKLTIHGGNQLMTRLLRSEYWIFKLKLLVKTIIHRCRICLLFKKHTQSQLMSSLPPERTTLSRPFENTGVDFTGPFNIKNFTGRACLITKGYVCIFVCFATKAIHLEATSDLTTQSFLAALSRFIGRRGCPARIYSDNGTNFVGAAELLKKDRIEFINQFRNAAIQTNSHQSLDWKFIPPGAPHMGGLWEAGVKSFKAHLRKLIPQMKFTFEEFSTILARIESCLNSRPLSPASDDPNDLNPLTPGHFLVGTPLLAPPEPDISENDVNFANRWRRLKIISQQFCQRWKSEYLKELHRRYKWKYQTENVSVNDLVIIKDEKTSPNEWKLGRIIKTFQGSDDNTRVVEIRTSTGIVTRPITKLIKLFSP